MYKISEDKKLNKILQEIHDSLPKIEYNVEYFMVKQFVNKKKIEHKFTNIDEAMNYFDNSSYKKKIYMKVSNFDELINLSFKPNLDKTMDHKYKPFGSIICYHLTWHDLERDGACFDESFTNDFIEEYHYWKKTRDNTKLDYTRLWVFLEGIEHIEIKEE